MNDKENIQIRKGKEHYLNELYETKERFISYWHQIDEIIRLKPNTVLDIGIGNGFVSLYLKRKGINITTLDIDPELRPAILGSVLAIPFVKNCFDVVACCQVLEHLPYENFSRALREFYRISRKNVILSLPDHTPAYRFNIEIPRMNPIKKIIPHPFPRLTHHEYDGDHYWIIGKKNYPLKRIEFDIQKTNFRIITSYRIYEFYGHRFFIIEK